MAEGLTQALGEEGADPGVPPGPCHLPASLLAGSDGPLHPRGGGGSSCGLAALSQARRKVRCGSLVTGPAGSGRVWNFPVISRSGRECPHSPEPHLAVRPGKRPGFLYRRLSEGGCDKAAVSGPQDSPQLRPFPFLALSSGAAGNERQVQILCWEPVMLPIIYNVPAWGPPAWASPPPPAPARGESGRNPAEVGLQPLEAGGSAEGKVHGGCGGTQRTPALPAILPRCSDPSKEARASGHF